MIITMFMYLCFNVIDDINGPEYKELRDAIVEWRLNQTLFVNKVKELEATCAPFLDDAGTIILEDSLCNLSSF